MWRFNLLLLRLLGEISLSLLCSHSSWGSALDLAPPLGVGRLRVSVPHPDRAGLKEQLIWGLWLTQAGGNVMRLKPAEAEVGVTLQQPGVHRVFSWGSCPCLDHGTLAVADCTGSPGSGGLHRGGVDSDLCLHTGFLVAAVAALVFHARLWCPR